MWLRTSQQTNQQTRGLADSTVVKGEIIMPTKSKHDPKLVKAMAKVAAATPKTPSALISLVMSLAPVVIGEALKGEGRRKFRSVLIIIRDMLVGANLDES